MIYINSYTKVIGRKVQIEFSNYTEITNILKKIMGTLSCLGRTGKSRKWCHLQVKTAEEGKKALTLAQGAVPVATLRLGPSIMTVIHAVMIRSTSRLFLI